MPNYFDIHAYMYKLWAGQAQFMTVFLFDPKCDFQSICTNISHDPATGVA